MPGFCSMSGKPTKKRARPAKTRRTERDTIREVYDEAAGASGLSNETPPPRASADSRPVGARGRARRRALPASPRFARAPRRRGNVRRDGGVARPRLRPRIHRRGPAVGRGARSRRRGAHPAADAERRRLLEADPVPAPRGAVHRAGRRLGTGGSQPRRAARGAVGRRARAAARARSRPRRATCS